MATDQNLEVLIKANADGVKSGMNAAKDSVKAATDAMANYSNQLSSETKAATTKMSSNYKEAGSQIASAMAGASASVKRSSEEIGNAVKSASAQSNASIDKMNQGFRRMGSEANVARELFSSVGGSISQIPAISFAGGALLTGLSATVALLAAVTKEAVIVHDSMIKISQLGDFTPKGLEKLKDDLLDLGTQIPLAFKDLSKIAAGGVQANIPTQDLKEYTALVAKASSAFDLLPEQASEAFGKIGNVYSLGMKDLSLFADSINKLADETASVAENDLLNFEMRVAGAGKTAGLSAQQMAALGATLLSFGTQPEIAASSMNSFLGSLNAVESQTDKFKAAMEAMGLPVKNFAELFAKDANKAINDLLTKLSQLDTVARANVISQMFGKGEDAQAILKLVSNLDKLKTAQDKVAESSKYAGNVNQSFQKSMESISAQWGRFTGELTKFAEGIGQFVIPALSFVIGRLQDVIAAFNLIGSAIAKSFSFASNAMSMLPDRSSKNKSYLDGLDSTTAGTAAEKGKYGAEENRLYSTKPKALKTGFREAENNSMVANAALQKQQAALQKQAEANQAYSARVASAIFSGGGVSSGGSGGKVKAYKAPKAPKVSDEEKAQRKADNGLMMNLEAELAEEKAAYQEKKSLAGAFHEYSKQQELKFWEDRKATLAAGSKHEPAVRRKIAELTQQINKDSFNAEIEAERAKYATYEKNADMRFVLESKIANKMMLAYGEDSKEYQAQLKVKLQAEHAAVEQRKKIRDMEAKVAEELKISQIEEQELIAQENVAIGIQTNMQLIEQQKTFEAAKSQIRKQGIIDRLKDIDPDRNPEEYKKTLLEIELLESAHQKKISALNRQSNLERMGGWKSAMSSVQQGFTQALQQIAKGQATLSQGMKAMFKTILDAAINMFTEMLAKWVAMKISEMIWGKTAATSTAQAKAAEAGAGGIASMAAAPFPINMGAPAFGAAMFAAASAYSVAAASPGHAVGAWNIPDDGITKVHKGETILNAQDAENFRNARGGQGGDIHLHINALDGADVKRVLMNNGGGLVQALKNQARNFKGVMR